MNNKTYILIVLLPCILCQLLQGQDVADAMKAIYMKDFDHAKEIINSGIDVNQMNRGSYLLHIACYRGNNELVELLIAKGAKTSITAEDGSTSLIQAAHGDTTGQIVELLIEKGVDVNATDKTGKSALREATYQACMNKNNRGNKIVIILLKHNAEVENEVPDGAAKGYTNMMTAAGWDKTELCELFIDYGADVNHQADDGNTPLMIAAKKGNLPLVKLLIKHGADKELKDCEGRKALHFAREEGNNAVINYLSR
ncbi:MAG: ankyrin repeat domain-containing protein [Bacteroidales bacterium]|nr:ankyrin repeat domain-containing protein [Bacteroidales bacterium]